MMKRLPFLKALLFPLVAVVSAYPALTAAAPRDAVIKGKLKGGNGFSVALLSTDGLIITSPVGSNETFEIRAPRSRIRNSTLQILRPDGTYFGPIFATKDGSSRERSQVGINRVGQALKGIGKLTGQGGNLGSATLGNGSAKLRKPSQGVLSEASTIILNNQRRPAGSGRLGLVDLRRGNTAGATLAATRTLPGQDNDRDGIPNIIDVDDNGNLVFDGSDANQGVQGNGAVVFSDLFVPLAKSLNLNAAGVTQAQIDTLIQEELSLVFLFVPQTQSDREVTAVDVDCGDLAYCAPGTGTAVIRAPFAPSVPRGTNWVTFDPNNDGFPSLAFGAREAGTFEIVVEPRVTTSQIRPGDTYRFRLTSPGGVVEAPEVLPFYFVTTPALQSYNDGSGAVPISYPVTEEAPGTPRNPIRLNSSNVALSFWRPQRPAVPGAETSTFVDMGNLFYQFYINLVAETTLIRCDSRDYTNPSTTLSIQNIFGSSQLKDSAADAPPNPANLLSVTLNLASCIERAGFSSAGRVATLDINAIDTESNNSLQQVTFQLP
jgi:hypothetical protein